MQHISDSSLSVHTEEFFVPFFSPAPLSFFLSLFLFIFLSLLFFFSSVELVPAIHWPDADRPVAVGSGVQGTGG